MSLPAVMKRKQLEVRDARATVTRALRELDILSRLNDGKRLSVDPKVIEDAKITLSNLRNGLPPGDGEQIVQTRKSDQVIFTVLTIAFFVAGVVNISLYWPHIKLILLGMPDIYESKTSFFENMFGIALCIFVFPAIICVAWRYTWRPKRTKESRNQEDERKILRLSKSLEVAALQYQTPTFACRGDFERCKVRQPSLWCYVALLICLIHELIPRIEAKINI